jgi:NAD(P)-dependent dehydrogenase (short-subunit alcohol dehydrogenase family)
MKTVLITGGNKGIGLELARGFLALKYNVIVDLMVNMSKV